jgi:hypothetical protein
MPPPSTSAKPVAKAQGHIPCQRAAIWMVVELPVWSGDGEAAAQMAQDKTLATET